MSPIWRLGVGWLTLFLVGTDLFVVSPLLPLIGGAYDKSGWVAGLSVSVFALAYMPSAPLLGRIADRHGRRATLVACLAVFAAANLLTAAAPGFGWLLLSRIAAGAAAAGVTPVIYAGVSDAAPSTRRATWMAIAVSGLLLALTVGAPAGSLIGSAYGWRRAFVALAAMAALLAPANHLVWPSDSGPVGGLGKPARAEASRLAPRLAPTVLWAMALYGMYTYLGVGLATAGYSPVQIARAIGLYGLAALAGTLVGGQTADRIGTRRTILASLAGLAAGLALLGFSLHPEWRMAIALALTSSFAQLFFPAQQTGLARDFAERRATVLAWNNSALFLGISLGSLVGGQAVRVGGFAADASSAAAIAVLAALAAASPREPAAHPAFLSRMRNNS